MIPFKKAHFVTSVFTLDKLPTLPKKEIALVGRSNVGKSSLINHLLNQKLLAKVSATPGKTQALNFFLIDEALFLVDLPGYGYAKAAKIAQARWSKLIEGYLENRPSLTLILFLVDIRRSLTADDRAFLEWCQHYQKPFLVIFTKSDKVKESEKQKLVASAVHEMKDFSPKDIAIYSIKDPTARKILIQKINQWV